MALGRMSLHNSGMRKCEDCQTVTGGVADQLTATRELDLAPKSPTRAHSPVYFNADLGRW